MNQPSSKPGGGRWPMTALVIMLMALFMTKGGTASLVPLVRALIPVVVVVAAYRIVRSYVRKQMFGEPPPARMDGRGGMGQEGKVIDLCPKCGSYLSAGHRCGK